MNQDSVNELRGQVIAGLTAQLDQVFTRMEQVKEIALDVTRDPDEREQAQVVGVALAIEGMNLQSTLGYELCELLWSLPSVDHPKGW